MGTVLKCKNPVAPNRLRAHLPKIELYPANIDVRARNGFDAGNGTSRQSEDRPQANPQDCRGFCSVAGVITVSWQGCQFADKLNFRQMRPQPVWRDRIFAFQNRPQIKSGREGYGNLKPQEHAPLAAVEDVEFG